MLNREEIANWPGAPASWTVTDEGMVVQRDHEVLLTIPVAGFPDLILRMAAVLRKG